MLIFKSPRYVHFWSAPRPSGVVSQATAKDIQRIQDRSIDIVGLARETLEPLSVRRDKQTGKAFKGILESADHPCRRFTEEVLHSYSFRSQRVRVPVPRTDRCKESFIQRGARM